MEKKIKKINKKPNPVAQAVVALKPTVIAPKKGKGSYRRRK